MNKKANIVFIINPKSGKGEKGYVEDLIVEYLNKKLFDYKIVYTEYAGHAIELAKNAANEDADIVVAVGGDGSVNEVGQGLVDTETALGIIPMGSGNGLARHLNIPIDPKIAIQNLNYKSLMIIDTAMVNSRFYLGTAGVGFDAEISHQFNKSDVRGLRTYVKLVFKSFFNYKERVYAVDYDGIKEEVEAFLITVANSNQYGNDFFISPDSELNDGWLELVIVKKPNIISLPFFLLRFFSGTLNRSRFVRIDKVKKVEIKQESKLVHSDGEPLELGTIVNFQIHPSSLKVLKG